MSCKHCEPKVEYNDMRGPGAPESQHHAALKEFAYRIEKMLDQIKDFAKENGIAMVVVGHRVGGGEAGNVIIANVDSEGIQRVLKEALIRRSYEDAMKRHNGNPLAALVELLAKGPGNDR